MSQKVDFNILTSKKITIKCFDNYKYEGFVKKIKSNPFEDKYFGSIYILNIKYNELISVEGFRIEKITYFEPKKMDFLIKNKLLCEVNNIISQYIGEFNEIKIYENNEIPNYIKMLDIHIV